MVLVEVVQDDTLPSANTDDKKPSQSNHFLPVHSAMLVRLDRRGALLRGVDGTMYFLLSPILGDYSAPLKISGYNAAQLRVTEK